MPVPHRFQNLLEEPDSNAVVNRDDVQGSIQKKLHDLHSCVVTGQSGVGKAREAGKAIQELTNKIKQAVKDEFEPQLSQLNSISPEQMDAINCRTCWLRGSWFRWSSRSLGDLLSYFTE